MSEKRYELRKQIKSVRWMIFWVVIARLAAEIAIGAAVSFMSDPPHEYIQIAVIELIAIGVPIVLYARTAWSGKSVKARLCLNRCSFGFICLAALLGICGQFVMMLLNVPANILMTKVFEQSTTANVPIASDGIHLLVGFFCVVLIPAVIEEFWMRGIIFHAYNRCNTRAAVLFTALIFSLLHMSVNEFIGFLLMGIMASLILVKSNSLYAAMVYHGFSNLTALLFGAYIMPVIIDYIWFVFAGMALVFIICTVVLVKQKTAMPVRKHFRAGGLVINSLFSMPVLLSIAVVVLKSFLLKIAG